MSDVLELGHRITVALDRIRRGMEAQDKADAAETSLFDALRAEQAQTGALRVQIQQLQDALDAQDRQAALESGPFFRGRLDEFRSWRGHPPLRQQPDQHWRPYL